MRCTHASLLVLLGCTGTAPKDGDSVGETGEETDSGGETAETDTDTGGETGEDSEETADSVETGEPSPLPAARVRLSSDVNTVGIVDWDEIAGATVVGVEYGEDEGYGLVAAERPDVPREALLLGLHAEQEVHFRLYAEIDGVTHHGPDQRFTTGELPEDLRGLRTSGFDGSWPHATAFLYTYPDEVRSWIVVLDDQGRVTWYAWFDRFVPSMRRALDGQSVYGLALGAERGLPDSTLEQRSLDGEGRDTRALPAAHHDFWLEADDSVVSLRMVTQDVEGWLVVGDQLVRTTPDGTETVIWDAFEDIGAVPDAGWWDRLTPDGVDWTHSNGIWRDDGSGDWFVSIYHEEAVRRVDGGTGRTEWVLGGEASDFDIHGEGFGPQHAPELEGRRLLLFDNGPEGETSRLVGYELDEGEMVASMGLSLEAPDGGHAEVLGDVHAVPGEGWVAAFGDHGLVAAWDPEGALRWQIFAASGYTIAQVEVWEPFGKP